MRDDQVFDILYFPPGSYRIELIVDHFVEAWKKSFFQSKLLDGSGSRPNKRRLGWGNERNRG